MDNVEKRLGKIERVIVRSNLIALLGIISSLCSKDERDDENKILKASMILLGAAVIINGITEIIDEIGS